MKAFFFSSLCLIGLSFLSCQNNELENNDTDETIYAAPQPPLEGTLLDGGRISEISLYCLPKNTISGKPWSEYYPEVKTVNDYSDFILNVMVHNDAPVYITDNTKVMRSITEIETEYNRNKSSFIIDAYQKNEGKLGWPELYTAYVNGEVTITCDKQLFGEVPGSVLNKYFSVMPNCCNCLPIGIEGSEFLYTYEEKIPTEMDELFAKGTWLQEDYNLKFSEYPAEKYEDVTLYLTFPVLIEHVRDFAVAKYKGKEIEPKYSEHVFNSECQIKFN